MKVKIHMSQTQEKIYIPHEGEREDDVFDSYIEIKDREVVRLYREYVHKVPNPISDNPPIRYLGNIIEITQKGIWYKEWHYAEGYTLVIDISADMSKYLGFQKEEIKDYKGLMEKIGEIIKKFHDDLKKTLDNLEIKEVKEAKREYEKLKLVTDNLVVEIDEKNMHAKIGDIGVKVDIGTSNFTNCVSRYCTILCEELNEEEEKEIDYSNYQLKDIIRDAKSAILNYLNYLVFHFYE